MNRTGRRLYFGFIALALAYIIINGILSHVASGRHKDPIFDQENKAWVASSSNVFDKFLCNWFGLCGGFNFLFASPPEQIDAALPIVNFADQWTLEPDNSAAWSDKERELREIPQYVFDHAPYVHLDEDEEYWPADLAEHLAHTAQSLNFTKLTGEAYGLHNLDSLNDEDELGAGRHIYLQSKDDVEAYPDWLGGRRNIPNTLENDDDDRQEEIERRKQPYQPHSDLRRRRSASPSSPSNPFPNPSAFARSAAPAFLITIPKPDGVLDAFWFFFYSFNRAPRVLGLQFGNHIGDWEHTLVRFRNGTPESVACSEHFFGSAYEFAALEKYVVNEATGEVVGTWSNRTDLGVDPKRPVVYSARGSHAMYARPGSHPYILPFNLLLDSTSRGPLWDPTLNLHAYTYDFQTLRAATRNPRGPTGWFDFAGRWGDKYYPLSDKRQWRFAGQYHYLNGPYGPRVKHLGREKVCQSLERCVVKGEVGGR